MNSFVAGGAGFIGSSMVDALIASGPVTVYDNFSSGRLEFLTQHAGNKNLVIVKGEISNLDLLTKSMSGHDIVFHFASNPDIAKGIEQTDLDIHEGTLLTYYILEAMRKNKIPKIMYASGSGVYGDVGLLPTAENYGPLLPISLYGASKLACEGLLSSFCHLYDMTAYIFRFANVVGKRQTHGVGYDFIRALRRDATQLTILGDGTQSKSYIHVTDIVDAIQYCIKHTQDRVNLLNVATETYIDVTTIAKIVIQELGLSNVKLSYSGGDRGWKGDVPIVRFDLGKIHALGWKSKLDSTQAVTQSISEMLGKT